jgi:hypothetical protein
MTTESSYRGAEIACFAVPIIEEAAALTYGQMTVREEVRREDLPLRGWDRSSSG